MRLFDRKIEVYPSAGESSKTHDILWLSGALLLVLIAFGNSLENGFVFDDHFLIVNNLSLKDKNYLSRIFIPSAEDSPVIDSPTAKANFVAYYRPFTRALFAINYRVFGLDSRGWHAVNLGLYLIVVVFAFFVLRSISRREEIYGPAILLFSLHPIHSEAVSWANCLVETLHGTFFLASFLFFIYWRESEQKMRILWFIASIISATCAIFSKELAVSLPLLIAGYIVLIESPNQIRSNLKTRVRSAALAIVPYLGVVAFYLILRYNAGGGTLQINNALNIDVTLRSLPLVIVKYLSLLLFPINLSPAYPTRPVSSFASAQFLVAAAIVLALTAIVARFFFRNSILRCAWLLLILPLIPLLNIGMLLPELMVQDRYLFLPSLGFCLLGGLLFASLPSVRVVSRRALLLLALTCYGTLAIKQNSYWRNDLDLFSHAVKVDPKSSFAHINLAGAYAEVGNMLAAEREYTQALRYNPDCSICFANIAQINYERGDRRQAVDFYREAIRYGYRDSTILNAFAVGSMEIGEITQAIAAFEEVARFNPGSAQAHLNAGQAYLIGGNITRAIDWFRQTIALDPSNAEAHFLLGISYERTGRQKEAIEEYKSVLSIKPDHARADESLKRLEIVGHKETKN
jgi:protein O-mannosyl-transferase